jgi:hypothetical protein
MIEELDYQTNNQPRRANTVPLKDGTEDGTELGIYRGETDLNVKRCTVVFGRLNVTKGLERTKRIVTFGRK